MPDPKRQNNVNDMETDSLTRELSDAKNKLLSRRYAIKKTGLTFVSGVLGFLGLGMSGLLQQKTSAHSCEDCSGKCVGACSSKCNNECNSNCINSCVDTCVIICASDCKSTCEAFCDGTTNKQYPSWENQVTQFFKIATIKEPP